LWGKLLLTFAIVMLPDFDISNTSGL